MGRFVFKSAVNMKTFDVTSFFDDASLTNETSTTCDVISGAERINLTGEGFTYASKIPLSGTITGGTMFVGGVTAITATKMNVDVTQLLNDANDNKALLADFFGGRDIMIGSTGNDVLVGFGGGDVVNGGKGNDTIYGGAGKDKLTGGLGADTFAYASLRESTSRAADRITDLDNTDKIDLRGLHVAEQADIHASYSAKTGFTTFTIDAGNDGDTDMTIVADGNHTDFAGFLI